LLAPIVVCVVAVCVDADTAAALLTELTVGSLIGGLFLASAAGAYWVQRAADTQQ
jgi:Flp pilus assembly protein TadB